jgi:hypothetical protein
MALIIAQVETPPPLPSPWPTLLELMIPWLFLGMINGTILASRPDVSVLERLRQLEEASNPRAP